VRLRVIWIADYPPLCFDTVGWVIRRVKMQFSLKPPIMCQVGVSDVK